ncbi:MAG: hypothetical protein NPINA01_21520 [Nitrospinaceae bacterium]|jgi:hypothetical protein|nr:MAG: hypothetical protein NPINA01_21520 [Nitrospinaceae bacterium]
MATVKVKFVKHSGNLLRYVQDKENHGLIVSGYNCVPETAAFEFEQTRKLHSARGSIEAVHVIQSFDPKERDRLTHEEFNQIGQNLAKKYFKDHQFVVVTHTDQAHIHNHIVVNSVNFETGKKVENKKYHLYKLRDLSDKLSIEKGLSVIEKRSKSKEIYASDKVRQIANNYRSSYVLDLMDKASFAKGYATNFSEYADVLSVFGIQTKVTNKNITYLYPGKSRGKRGSKMGKAFDKESLASAFEENKAKYSSRPELREHLLAEIGHLKKIGYSFENSPMHQKFKYKSYFLKHDWDKFNKDMPTQTEREIKNSPIPERQFKDAHYEHIFKYLDRHKIKYFENSEGKTVLKGKEFVRLFDYEWVNTKNGTRGSLIDLVAINEKLSYLQAISKINNNPRLLLLEKHFGKVQRNYQSFYIPKSEQMDRQKAVRFLSNFLSSKGVKPDFADDLLKKKMCQISKSGFIRLFSENDDSRALEFHQNSTGEWQQKRYGVSSGPFYSHRGRGNSLLVFRDPFSYMKSRKNDLFSEKSSDPSVLVLTEARTKTLDFFLNENPKISKIYFIGFEPKNLNKNERRWFELTNRKYKPFSIEMEGISLEKSKSPGLERGFGLDISF